MVLKYQVAPAILSVGAQLHGHTSQVGMLPWLASYLSQQAYGGRNKWRERQKYPGLHRRDLLVVTDGDEGLRNSAMLVFREMGERGSGS